MKERNPDGVAVPERQVQCRHCGAWRNATESRCLVVGCRGSLRLDDVWTPGELRIILPAIRSIESEVGE